MDVFSSSVGLLYLTILPYNVMPVGYKGGKVMQYMGS